MMLFRGMTEDAIQASLRKDRELTDAAAQRELKDLITFYEGGSRMESYLVRRPGEDMYVAGPNRQDRYNYRKSRAHNPNYFARLTDALVDGFVGDPIIRRLEGNADDELQRVWRETKVDLVQQEYGLATVLTGNAVVNIVGWEDGGVTLVPVHPFNVRLKAAPNDPYTLAEVEEDRTYTDAQGKEHTVTWVWNDEWGRLYDENGKRLMFDPMTGNETAWAEPNPYGVTPYVHWRGRPTVGQFEGMSYVRDQLTLQKEVYNRTNDLMVLCHLRSFGVPVLKDFQGDQLDWSEYGALEVGPNGDAWMLEPSGNIDGMLLSLDRLIDWMFQTGGVPVDVVKGQVAESGVALQIKWQPYVRVIQTLRTQGAVSEEDLIRKVCAIGKEHGYKLPDANKAEPVVEYDAAIVPNDNVAEFQRDLLMLNNEPPLMSRDEFIRKWHGLEDDDAVAAYMAKLDEETASKQEEEQPEEDPFAAEGLTI